MLKFSVNLFDMFNEQVSLQNNHTVTLSNFLKLDTTTFRLLAMRVFIRTLLVTPFCTGNLAHDGHFISLLYHWVYLCVKIISCITSFSTLFATLHGAHVLKKTGLISIYAQYSYFVRFSITVVSYIVNM